MKVSSVKLVVAMVTLFLSLVPLTAIASTYGIDDINDLKFLYNTGDSNSGSTDYKTGVTLIGGSFPFTTGTYGATFLGYEAGHTDGLMKNDSTFLFKTQTTGSSVGDTANVDVASAFYRDVNDSDDSAFLLSNLKVYSLLGSYLNSYANMSGWTSTFDNDSLYYVVGFGDGADDHDYDDLVIAVKANPVPIPAAVWLLGSGLLGLVGIRRRKK